MGNVPCGRSASSFPPACVLGGAAAKEAMVGMSCDYDRKENLIDREVRVTQDLGRAFYTPIYGYEERGSGYPRKIVSVALTCAYHLKIWLWLSQGHGLPQTTRKYE
jgi:hypothetical protein